MTSENTIAGNPANQGEPFLVYLKKFAKYLGLFVLGLLGIVLIAAIFKIPLPLPFVAGIVEGKAETALDRQVQIGWIFVVPGLQPEVEVTELRLGNPQGWPDGLLARIDSFSADLDLPALFDRRIHLGRIAVSGVQIDLDTLADGKNNWTFVPPEAEDTTNKDTKTEESGDGYQFYGLDLITITKIAASYRDRGEKYKSELSVDQITGSVPKDAPIELTVAGGEMSNSTFAGDFSLDLKPDIPKLSGTVDVHRLDLEPLAQVYAEDEPAAESEASVLETLSRERISLSGPLGIIDTDLQLKLHKVINAAVDIRDANVHLSINKGQVEAPMSVIVNGVALNGSVLVAQPGRQLELAVSLDAGDVDIGELTGGLFGTAGTLNKLSFKAESAGKSLRALVRKINMHLRVSELNLSYRNTQGSTPVNLTLDSFDLTISPTDAIFLRANGRALDENFSLTFKGGELKKLLKSKPWPVELTAAAVGAALSVHGIIMPPVPASGIELKFNVTGGNLGDLAKWTGLATHTTLPYTLNGTLSMLPKGLAVQSISASLGKTQITGSVEKNTSPAGSPMYALNFLLDTLDLDELSTAFAPPEGEGAVEPAPASQQDSMQKIDLRMPILPKNIELPDADFNVSTGNLSTGKVKIKDVALSARFRNGRLEKSPFQAVIGATLFQGDILFDPSKPVPQLDLSLLSEKLDVGVLLENLKVAERIPVRAERVQIDLMLKGHRLRSLLRQSELRVQVTGGTWGVETADAAPLPVIIDKATLEVIPGKPIRLVQEMTVHGVPVKIEAATQGLISLADRTQQKFRAELKTGETVMTLTGAVGLPIRKRELDLKLSLHGKRINELSKLLGTNLPGWGPYRLEGGVQMDDRLISLEGLSMQVGSSRLTGRAILDWKGDRKKVDVKLVAREIQFDDFPLKDTGDGAKKADGLSQLEDKAEPTGESPTQDRNSVAKKSPGGMDVNFLLKVKEILSGKDRLGDGIVQVVFADGLLQVHPFTINLPGGSFDMRYLVNKENEGFVSRFTANIDKFDYGVIARSMNPKKDSGGDLSLDVDLTAPTADAEKFLALASGHLDFVLKPRNFEASILDFWSTGLISAILRHIVSTSESLINCAIARFDMKDGIMDGENIVIDTTKIRIEGEGEADFKAGTLKLKLTPTAKKAQFYSLETPIEIDGSFDEIKVGMAGGGLIGTAARFVTSPLLTPLKRLFQKELPEDGSDVCKQPMQREK